jgi:hypothetical protein
MIKQHLGGEPWVSVRTLLTWRKEFSAGRVKNDEANDVFAVGRELVQARCGDTQYLRQFAIGRVKAAGKVDGVFGPAPNTP